MFNKLKPYIDSPEYVVIYDSEELKNLTITDKTITTTEEFTTPEGKLGSWTFTFAENDKECDHGLYRTIPEWKKWFKDSIKIYTTAPVKWE
jgi:hypothetical protein